MSRFFQVNQVTHWIDGSAIYDTSADFNSELRLFRGGLLAFELNSDGGQTMPTDKSGSTCGPQIGKCFRTGFFLSFETFRESSSPAATPLTGLSQQHPLFLSCLASYIFILANGLARSCQNHESKILANLLVFHFQMNMLFVGWNN